MTSLNTSNTPTLLIRPNPSDFFYTKLANNSIQRSCSSMTLIRPKPRLKSAVLPKKNNYTEMFHSSSWTSTTEMFQPIPMALTEAFISKSNLGRSNSRTSSSWTSPLNATISTARCGGYSRNELNYRLAKALKNRRKLTAVRKLRFIYYLK